MEGICLGGGVAEREEVGQGWWRLGVWQSGEERKVGCSGIQPQPIET